MRVHSNIGLLPCRRLKQKFGSNDHAIGTSNPNTLHSNLPSRADSMGMTGKDGILSFIHDGADQSFSVYIWHAGLNAVDPTMGWVLISNLASTNTQDVPPGSLAALTVPEGVPFFITAGTSLVSNCWVSGEEDPANPNTLNN